MVPGPLASSSSLGPYEVTQNKLPSDFMLMEACSGFTLRSSFPYNGNIHPSHFARGGSPFYNPVEGVSSIRGISVSLSSSGSAASMARRKALDELNMLSNDRCIAYKKCAFYD